MKLSLQAGLLTFAAVAFNGVHACFQVHTDFYGDIFAGDSLSVQAKNNNAEVCTGAASGAFSSSKETVWTITCAPYTFTFTQNGAVGHVSDSSTGYQANLVMSSHDTSEEKCYCNDDDDCLNCPEEETCLDDNYWNCNDYPYCTLCDFRGYCSGD